MLPGHFGQRQSDGSRILGPVSWRGGGKQQIEGGSVLSIPPWLCGGVLASIKGTVIYQQFVDEQDTLLSSWSELLLYRLGLISCCNLDGPDSWWRLTSWVSNAPSFNMIPLGGREDQRVKCTYHYTSLLNISSKRISRKRGLLITWNSACQLGLPNSPPFLVSHLQWICLATLTWRCS